MPSTATITSFYTFAAGSKARATQVNDNFSVFRGHIIPVDPNTIASANVTYDLGSDRNRWRTAYVQSIDFDRSTSTASASMQADLNTGTGEIVLKLQGTEVYRFVGDLSPQYSVGTNTTQIVGNTNSGGVLIPGSTLTISTHGKHVELRIVPYVCNSIGVQPPCIIFDAQTTTAQGGTLDLYTYRNTTTSFVGYYRVGVALSPTTTADGFALGFPISIAVDTSAPTGTHNYFVHAYSNGQFGASNSQVFMYLANYKFMATQIDHT